MPAFDSSVLLLALDPDVNVPTDTKTNKPVEFAAKRVENLIRMCRLRNERIIIPMPVLTEVLVHAGDAWDEYQDILEKPPFSIASFDKKAAIEAAVLMEKAFQHGKKRNPAVTKTKIKFDRLIVAIAKAQGAGIIYSDDEDIHKLAEQTGLIARRTSDLPLPPVKGR